MRRGFSSSPSTSPALWVPRGAQKEVVAVSHQPQSSTRSLSAPTYSKGLPAPAMRCRKAPLALNWVEIPPVPLQQTNPE